MLRITINTENAGDEVDSLRSKVTPMKELTSQLFERSEVNVPGLSSRLCGEKNHLVF